MVIWSSFVLSLRILSKLENCAEEAVNANPLAKIVETAIIITPRPNSRWVMVQNFEKSRTFSSVLYDVTLPGTPFPLPPAKGFFISSSNKTPSELCAASFATLCYNPLSHVVSPAHRLWSIMSHPFCWPWLVSYFPPPRALFYADSFEWKYESDIYSC